MYIVTDSEFEGGADPSGEEDSRAAIQDAINTAAGADPAGGIVYFPAGTYKISTASSGLGLELKAGIQYVGEGRGNTILKLDTATTGEPLHLMEVSAGRSDITIRDMTLDLNGEGASGTRPVALRLDKSSRVLIQNVEFTTTSAATYGYGLQIGSSGEDDTGEITVQGCIFTQMGETAIHVQPRTRNLRVTDCFFALKSGSHTFKALHIADTTALTAVTIRRIAFCNNFIQDDLDIEIAGRLDDFDEFYPVEDLLLRNNFSAGNLTLTSVRRALVQSNTIQPASGAPLTLKTSHDVNVLGNTLSATTGHVLYVEAIASFEFPTLNLLIAQNTLLQQHVSASSYGIFLTDCERTRVLGNTLVYTPGTAANNIGLFFIADPDNLSVDRNNLLIAQNTITGFYDAIRFSQFEANSSITGVILAHNIAQAHPNGSNAAFRVYGSTVLKRVTLTGLVVGGSFTYGALSPPPSLAAGTLGLDSSDTASVGVYVTYDGYSGIDHIENAPKGSLYVKRSTGASGSTLFVRESSSWVGK